MNWYRAATAIVCLGLALTLARADGMPQPDDENYNPVPSIPGVPGPGVPSKPPMPPGPKSVADEPPPAPAPAPYPAPPPPPQPTPAPAPAPTPAPTPAPVAEAPPPTTPAPAAPAPATPPPAAPAPVTPAPTPPAPTPPPATQAGVKKPVYEISSIDVQLAERQPPFLTVTVKGVVRTGGWKDLELRPLPTLAKEVGMRSYTLVATPPTGMATQALSNVTATITIDPLPNDVKTIRVLGETNEVAQTFR